MRERNPCTQVPGPDVAAWQAYIATPAAAARMAADVALGKSLGVGATPTFVISGVE